MGEARRIADALLLLADAHEVSLTAIRLRRSGGGTAMSCWPLPIAEPPSR
jgi:hypothetical protein